MSKGKRNANEELENRTLKEKGMTEEKELPKRLSRKDFVKGAAVGAGALAGASALASCGQSTTPAETAEPCPTCPPAEECPACTSAWMPESWDEEADVVIVGYGGAGVSAAIAAHDAGAEVLVLEKAPTPEGGNSGCAGGATQLPQPLEEAIDYLRATCWGTVTDEELLRAHTVASNELPDWLEDLGAELVWLKMRMFEPMDSAVPASITGSETLELGNIFVVALPDGNPAWGKGTFAFLHGCAQDRGIEVMLSTAGKELIQDPQTKEILGVKAIAAGEAMHIKARKGVILACGGFEADQDMVHQTLQIGSHSLVIPTMGTPYNTGDGLYMAARAGAKLWHMNSAEVYHRCAKLASEELGVGFGVSDTADHIWVNRYGKRFMNERMVWMHTHETLPMFHFSHKHASVDGEDLVDYPNVPFYMIFDETTRKKGAVAPPGFYTYASAHNLYEWSEDNTAEIEKGWIIQGDTLEELGQSIECKDFFGRVVGMDAAGLVETVTKYNQYCAAGNDPDFGRPAEELVPIQTPPFYAMELCIGNINTNGGPVHNQYWQTLDTDDTPIPRLYSTGELGSIYGFLYLAGGNFAEALSSGRFAGEHAAALEPWDT